MSEKAYPLPTPEQRQLFLQVLHSLVNAKETTLPEKGQPATVAWIWQEGKDMSHLRVLLRPQGLVAGVIYIELDPKGDDNDG